MRLSAPSILRAAARRQKPAAIFKGEVLVRVIGPGNCDCGTFVWPKLELYKLRFVNLEGGGYIFEWQDPSDATQQFKAHY